MSDNQQYLNELKGELDSYTKKLSQIQSRFKGNTKDDAGNIVDSLKSILQEAKTAYSELKSASADEWKPMKKISTQAFATLKSSFDEALADSSNGVKDYVNQIEHFSEEQLEYAGEYIRNNPFTSVLIAAGVGYIVGKIFK